MILFLRCLGLPISWAPNWKLIFHGRSILLQPGPRDCVFLADFILKDSILLLLDSGTWAGLIPSPPLAMDDCAATELALLCDADDWLAPSCLVVKKLSSMLYTSVPSPFKPGAARSTTGTFAAYLYIRPMSDVRSLCPAITGYDDRLVFPQR